VSHIWICFGFGKIATIRRRGAHIANVVPGPRPRTGFGGGDVKHCLLLWWYAVGADQATKLHVWRLIFHCRCIGNGKKEGWFVLRHVGIEAFYPSRFFAIDHDFLRLPQLLKTFCNHDCHVRQIKLALDQVALLCGTFEMHQSASDHLNPKTLILIWDTGASAGLTPFRSDFIDYVKCKIDVRDITKVNKVVGIGTTLHKFVDNNGNHVYLLLNLWHT
jgi:hypothetical protein